MKILKDIKGYWKYILDSEFFEVQSWEGKLILEEDGWFEGIVKECNEIYKGDIFIFGIYFPGKGIELLKVAPQEISNPFVFRAEMEESKYIGKFSIIDLFGESVIGNTYLDTCDSKEEEFENLLNRIESFKGRMIRGDYAYLYENTINIKDRLCLILNRKYNKITLKPEEVCDIMNEMKKHTELVESLTVEKVFQRELIPPFMDDDIPF